MARWRRAASRCSCVMPVSLSFILRPKEGLASPWPDAGAWALDVVLGAAAVGGAWWSSSSALLSASISA